MDLDDDGFDPRLLNSPEYQRYCNRMANRQTLQEVACGFAFILMILGFFIGGVALVLAR